MIKLGRTNYWFTGDRFVVGNPASSPHRDLTDEDREPLLRYLCTCAFGLNRWQGEENEHGHRWSVGDHSILVAALAGRLAILRTPKQFADSADMPHVSAAVRVAAAHDLGETLGLGDIAAPWLRGRHGTSLASWCAEHQRLAYEVSGIDKSDPSYCYTTVKDADHLAAALERRYFFGDTSGDMEHPDAQRLIDEVFPYGDDGEFPLVDAHVDWSFIHLDLVQGNPRGDVYVLGDRMIRDGKAVAP